MLFYVLSDLVCLLHPVIPFVTEEIWQRMRQFCPTMEESVAIAEWPELDDTPITMFAETEKQFSVFRELLRAVRDVRASRNIPPKTEISFSVRCDEATAKLLEPMKPYFASMAKAKATAFSPSINGAGLTATVPLTGMDVFVDISNLIDVPAEIAKLEKEIAKLDGFIQAKEAKLNGGFIEKAPAAVVEKERQSLAELQTQRQSAAEALTKLKV
jgi:valyl-tRNA synthetase